MVNFISELKEMVISLWMQYNPNPVGDEPGPTFLSSVTKYLVFRRMPWLRLQLNVQHNNYEGITPLARNVGWPKRHLLEANWPNQLAEGQMVERQILESHFTEDNWPNPVGRNHLPNSLAEFQLYF